MICSAASSKADLPSAFKLALSKPNSFSAPTVIVSIVGSHLGAGAGSGARSADGEELPPDPDRRTGQHFRLRRTPALGYFHRAQRRLLLAAAAQVRQKAFARARGFKRARGITNVRT